MHAPKIFHIKPANLPTGRPRQPGERSVKLTPPPTREEAYQAEMRRILLETKFLNASETYKASPQFESDVTEEMYRRVDRFHDCLVPWISRVIDLRGKTCIEVGSGTGSSTLAFAPYVEHIHCFEIEPASTNLAKQRLALCNVNNVTFWNGLFDRNCELHQQNKKVDVVLLVAVLEHLYFSELKDVLQLAFDMLAPGGVILIAETPNRLSFNDYHTSWLPFFQWLPREVANEYMTWTPRQILRDGLRLDEPASYTREKIDSRFDAHVRMGRGVSYHDFELALGPYVHKLIALDGWEQEVRPLAPVFDDDHILLHTFDSLQLHVNRAFARSWLYLALQKPRIFEEPEQTVTIQPRENNVSSTLPQQGANTSTQKEANGMLTTSAPSTGIAVSSPARIPPNLKDYGAKAFSQNEEDGIIAAIFNAIGTSSRCAVEFGIGPNYLDREYVNGLEGNTPLLRQQGWNVLLMDGGTHPPQFDVKQHFITASNINQLFAHYQIPADVDLVSIDVDGQDYWIWKYLDWRPRVVMIEYNPNFHNINQRLSVAYNESHVWDGTRYYGASYGAMISLGREKGYVPVYANGTNLFFVQRELVANPDDFDAKAMMVTFEMHLIDPHGRPWVAV